MKIEVENLIASTALAVSGEKLSAAEAIASLVLADYNVPFQEAFDAACLIAVTTAARTGAIFVFDSEDAPVATELESAPDELPPLPFKRCWFEVWAKDEQAPIRMHSFEDYDGQRLAVVAYAIYEAEQGAEWTAYGVFVDEADPSAGSIILSWRLLATAANQDLIRDKFQRGKGSVLRGGDAALDSSLAIEGDPRRSPATWRTTPENMEALEGTYLLPVVLAQMVDIVGATHRPVVAQRPTRRRFERRWGVAHPNIYVIDLRGTGDNSLPTGLDSHYRHRWLVRGHYRRDPGGRYTILGKGPCTWVRPYVKGPIGAPWKGRGIYAVSA